MGIELINVSMRYEEGCRWYGKIQRVWLLRNINALVTIVDEEEEKEKNERGGESKHYLSL